ncbi:hypothetical protein C8R44DRAFT_728314 [Mycena epipterygia]|nr:hypothetical protein C8R44DRAFT_728314 [Mycena epipterygia]
MTCPMGGTYSAGTPGLSKGQSASDPEVLFPLSASSADRYRMYGRISAYPYRIPSRTGKIQWLDDHPDAARRRRAVRRTDEVFTCVRTSIPDTKGKSEVDPKILAVPSQILVHETLVSRSRRYGSMYGRFDGKDGVHWLNRTVKIRSRATDGTAAELRNPYNRQIRFGPWFDLDLGAPAIQRLAGGTSYGVAVGLVPSRLTEKQEVGRCGGDA